MRIRSGSLLIAVTLPTLILLPLWAGPLATSGTWYEFSFPASIGGSAAACTVCVPGPGAVTIDSPPWTFNGPATLTVTDAFNRGDSFNVFDNGNPIGSTPAVGSGGSCGSDPAVCLADPLVSHGVFSLGPGAHSITITVAATVGSGAAYVRVTADAPTAIPALSTAALAGLGMLLAGVAGWSLRRRTSGGFAGV